MDTSKMICLDRMDAAGIDELLQMTRKFGRIADTLKTRLKKTFLREQIIEVVEGAYDLGKVMEVYEILGGYINRSFGLVVEKHGVRTDYFLRKYKKGITGDEILFEHAMISHSIANGLTICASVLPTKDGSTFTAPGISRSKFAVYTFLKGEDKYTWDNPIMEDPEYESAARVLAAFHNAAKDFDPRGRARAEPKILDMIPGFITDFSTCAEKKRDTRFHRYYRKKLDTILSVIRANTIPEEDISKMPMNPIHCDFHPGNLKFENKKVVGIFDFDWSKIDLRIFDVCLALAYCASCWDEENDGIMLLDKCRIFLTSYQERLMELNGLMPMNETELAHFPTMMAMANFYLLNWDIIAYYAEEDCNDHEYLVYLKHNVRLLEWIEENKGKFAEIAASIEPFTPNNILKQRSS